MADESNLGDTSQESAAIEYEEAAEVRRNVSPTTHSKWRNAIRPNLKPVACWRVQHTYFHFDSSVILPEMVSEIAALKPLIMDHRVATIFGHADPVGSIDYNAHLSARRARALFGLLTRNIDIWLDLFADRQSYDAWGLISTQTYLSALPRKDGNGPYYTKQIDGAFGPRTDEAVRIFQGDEDLAVDGAAGPVTRRRLYELYMDMLTSSPAAPLMRPDQFLGDPVDNADPKGKAKAAFQGCSEHNPIVLFSADEEERLAGLEDKTERNLRNAPNRRVMVLFFSKKRLAGMTPAEVRDVWPCPAWSEGPAACAKSLWPDHKKRLENADKERRYAMGEHTMACSWYDRLVRLSPCEGRFGQVNVIVEWPDAFTPYLPPTLHFELTFGGQNFGIEWRHGLVEDGARRFVFRNVAPGPCTLRALDKDRTLELWVDQTVSNFDEPPSFSHRLEEWLVAHADSRTEST